MASLPLPHYSLVVLVMLWLSLRALIPCFADNDAFLVHPAPSIILEPGQHRFKALTCVFRPSSPTDVIGWVVNGTRISNNREKQMNSATTKVLVAKFQVKYNETSTGSSAIVYEIDFFDGKLALAGSYKCQLCSDNTCTTVIAKSSVSKVMVRYEPSVPPTCIQSTTRVVLGESASLSCASEPGLPVVQLEWLRGAEMIPGQENPVILDEVLYNNVTLTPSIPDASYTCRMTASLSKELNCSIASFILVSTPRVMITPFSAEIMPGSRSYVCSATSDTNTTISSYKWKVDDIGDLQVVVNGSFITIHDITASDHQKVVRCEVTDEQNMTGFGQTILVDGKMYSRLLFISKQSS